MEIKVECPCGQSFEFEVEPVDGQMPCEVRCPTCGADGTALANARILEQLAETVSAAKPLVSAPPSFGTGRPAAVTMPAPAPARTFPVPPRASRKVEPANRDLLTGVAGALIGGFLGMLGWFLLIKATGVAIGYAAWAVGGITGLGARIVGGDGSRNLGLLAGLMAALAILGGQYWAVRDIAGGVFEKEALKGYQEQLDIANSAVALKTDDEIKAFIAKEDEIKVPSQVTGEQVEQFRNETLPRLREFIGGKPSKEQFVAKVIAAARDLLPSNWELFQKSFSGWTLLWLFLGIGSAYKLGAGSS